MSWADDSFPVLPAEILYHENLDYSDVPCYEKGSSLENVALYLEWIEPLLKVLLLFILKGVVC